MLKRLMTCFSFTVLCFSLYARYMQIQYTQSRKIYNLKLSSLLGSKLLDILKNTLI